MIGIKVRIITAIPLLGCELKDLRAKLWDIEPAPFDYALQGLRDEGHIRLLDGYISRIPTAAMVQT